MTDLKKTYKPSLYKRIYNSGYKYSKIIIPELQKEFEINSVIDIGCGGGSFLRGCREMGLIIHGIDGEHVESSLQIPKRLVDYRNLEEPLLLNGFYDLAVSLEVAEHLHEEFADILIDSICGCSQNVLFSAAQVGQPGKHHVNNQPLEYWRTKFYTRGYYYNVEMSEWIRKNKNIYHFYRKNSMVFKRK